MNDLVPDATLNYPRLAADAERMCQEIHRQLEKVIKEERIDLGFPLQYRVKTLESVRRKLESFSQIKSIAEMQDITGIRITLIFQRDIKRVVDKLNALFNVQRQYNTLDRMREDQFGYSSTHLIVKISEDWLHLPTFFGLTDTTMEIQVRTLAQHTWAMSSHVLQYKRTESVPKTLRRSINRIAALLETVDLELERLLTEQANYIKDLDVLKDDELNVDSLEVVMDELYPAISKDKNEQYDQLMPELIDAGLNTISKVRNFIISTREDALLRDKERIKEVRAELKEGKSIGIPITSEDLDKGVFYVHTGLLRISLPPKIHLTPPKSKDLPYQSKE